MAEGQDVQGIALGLTLDTTGFSAGLAKAKAELAGLGKQARIEAGVSFQAKRGQTAGATQLPAATLSPQLQVSKAAVRDLRVDINQHLRTLATQGEAVAVPVKLGRVNFGALRSEISSGIGAVPIKITIDGSSARGQKSVLSAVLASSTGVSLGKADANIEQAAISQGIKKRARGGYVVNEKGSEGFVPARAAGLIPRDVMQQIPGGQQMWSPPEDGWVIPAHLKHRMGHRESGGLVFKGGRLRHASGRFATAAEIAAYQEEQNRRLAAREATADVISQQRRESAALRASVAGTYPEESFDPVQSQMQSARASQAAIRGLTGRAAVGGVAGFFAGGGRERRQAALEATALNRQYATLPVPKGQDPIEFYTRQLTKADAQARKSAATLEDIEKTYGRSSGEYRRHKKTVQEDADAVDVASSSLQKATKIRVAEQDAIERSQGGVARNFLAITAAGFAYSAGLQAISGAMSVASSVARPLVDQLSGFGATAQRVTKDLAGALPGAGTTGTLFAQAGTGAGLSAQATAFIEKALGGSVVAKAGAAAAGQASDLFRAAIGNGAPSGLTGGFGGLFGTGFGAEQLGGGKGFAEQIAGDVAVSKGQAGSAGLGGEIVDNLGKGIGSVGRSLNNIPKAFDILLGGQSKLENPLVEVVAISQEQLKVQRELVDNFNQAVGRGARAQGGGGGARLADVGIGSAEATQVLGISGIDDYTRQLADAGVVFKDTTGNVLTSIVDINKAYSAAALGFTLPDAATFLAQSKQGQLATEAVGARQTQQTIGTIIPGQIGQQLAATPFTPAGTGIAAGFKSTIADLGVTQRLQDDITKDGIAGLQAQRTLIEQNLGLAQGADFGRYMGEVQQYGQEIAGLTATLSNRQAALGAAQYGNQIRIINRSISDAKGLISGQGGPGNLGALERRQFNLGRQGQSLQFELSQRQINFQTAVAGFQAPGITGQERAARIEEAKLEASFAQRGLNIGKEQFGVEGQVFREQASRQLEDLERQKAITAEQYAVEQEQLAVQKRIAVLTARGAAAQAKAGAIFSEATSIFDSRLGLAAQYVAQFGGTLAQANDALRAVLGLPPVRQREQGHAAGIVGMATGRTTATFGEAGTEGVAIIRNPRTVELGAGGGVRSGGGGTVIHMPITITGNNISGQADEERLIRRLRDAIEDSLGQKAKLLQVSSF